MWDRTRCTASTHIVEAPAVLGAAQETDQHSVLLLVALAPCELDWADSSHTGRGLLAKGDAMRWDGLLADRPRVQVITGTVCAITIL